MVWHLLSKNSNARYIQPVTLAGTNPAQCSLTIKDINVEAGRARVDEFFVAWELTWNLPLAPFLGWPC